MTAWGMGPALGLLGVLGAVGVTLALKLWPEGDPVVVPHTHTDLPDDHPHVKEHGRKHAHAYVIDDAHHVWPTNG